MAQRRMFSKTITSSDSFLSMSATAQNLYFHLGMEADDDGFAPFTKISKMLGTSHDDMAQLIGRGFLLQFTLGVYVIRDWKINNEIRKDRYQPTIYQQELKLLRTNAVNQYVLPESQPLVLPNDNHLSPQDRIGKDRIGKDRIGKDILVSKDTKAYGNEDVKFLLEQFKDIYGFYPIDRQPNRVAWNILQKFSKTIREKGFDPQESSEKFGTRLKKSVTYFFEWVEKQKSLEKAKTLDVLKRNIEVWVSGVKV